MAKKMAKKRMEFSKVMAVITIFMWMIVNIFCMVIVVVTFDTTPLAYIVPSIDGALAVVLGFYYWKAKAENQIKLKMEYGEYAPEPDINDEGGYKNGY